MPRPVTLFTGQWADLPLEKLAPLARRMGYDGLELACWGDHFDVDRALSSKKYVHDHWALLEAHGLTCHALSSHLVGQAICDLIDERHQSILPPDVHFVGRLGTYRYLDMHQVIGESLDLAKTVLARDPLVERLPAFSANAA